MKEFMTFSSESLETEILGLRGTYLKVAVISVITIIMSMIVLAVAGCSLKVSVTMACILPVIITTATVLLNNHFGRNGIGIFLRECLCPKYLRRNYLIELKNYQNEKRQ